MGDMLKGGNKASISAMENSTSKEVKKLVQVLTSSVT
jgi:hypothetical protein